MNRVVESYKNFRGAFRSFGRAKIKGVQPLGFYKKNLTRINMMLGIWYKYEIRSSFWDWVPKWISISCHHPEPAKNERQVKGGIEHQLMHHP